MAVIDSRSFKQFIRSVQSKAERYGYTVTFKKKISATAAVAEQKAGDSLKDAALSLKSLKECRLQEKSDMKLEVPSHDINDSKNGSDDKIKVIITEPAISDLSIIQRSTCYDLWSHAKAYRPLEQTQVKQAIEITKPKCSAAALCERTTGWNYQVDALRENAKIAKIANLANPKKGSANWEEALPGIVLDSDDVPAPELESPTMIPIEYWKMTENERVHFFSANHCSKKHEELQEDLAQRTVDFVLTRRRKYLISESGTASGLYSKRSNSEASDVVIGKYLLQNEINQVICYKYWLFLTSDCVEGWSTQNAGSVFHYRDYDGMKDYGSRSWFRHHAICMADLALRLAVERVVLQKPSVDAEPDEDWNSDID